MTSHKPLKSVSHNFGHSFISLMNYVKDDYLLGHLLNQARQTKINKLTVDILKNVSEPTELLTNEIKSSIENKSSIKGEDIRRAGVNNGGRFFEDNQGNKLFNNALFYNAHEFYGEYCVVTKMINGKELCGVINSKGEQVIDFAYNTILDNTTHSAYFIVGNKLDNRYKYGMVDSTGKLIIPTIYGKLGEMKNGVVKAQLTSSKWGLINSKNETLAPFTYDFIGSWSDDGLARVKKTDANYRSLTGYINTAGKLIIDCQYNLGSDFSQGIALVQKGNKIGFINSKNETVIDFIYDDFKEIVDLVKNETKIEGYGEENKRFIMEEGYIVLQKDNKWGYIDVKGNVVIPFDYSYIGLPNKSQLVQVEKDKTRGQFNLQTKKVEWYK